MMGLDVIMAARTCSVAFRRAPVGSPPDAKHLGGPWEEPGMAWAPRGGSPNWRKSYMLIARKRRKPSRDREAQSPPRRGKMSSLANTRFQQRDSRYQPSTWRKARGHTRHHRRDPCRHCVSRRRELNQTADRNCLLGRSSPRRSRARVGAAPRYCQALCRARFPVGPCPERSYAAGPGRARGPRARTA